MAPLRQHECSAGYFGMFEAEFIRLPGRSLLIDINGRLYNQLAFDVARGLPLPTLFYQGALGNDEAVAAATVAAAGADSTGPQAFSNRSRLAKPPSRFQARTQMLRQPHCQRDDG